MSVMGMDWYKLDENKKVVKCADHVEGARNFEDISKHRVDETNIGDIRISTVFLGLDHSFGDRGPPLVFETMVFGGPEKYNDYQDRYSTWEQAVAGHNAVVEKIKRGEDL